MGGRVWCYPMAVYGILSGRGLQNLSVIKTEIQVLCFPKFFSERHYGKQGHFEMLKAERNADNGDAADEPEDKVCRRYLPPAAQNPKNIHEYAETASSIVSVHDISAERPQRKRTELPQLVPEWNAYDGHAIKQSSDEVAEGDQQASQNQPKNIPDESHKCSCVFLVRNIRQISGDMNIIIRWEDGIGVAKGRFRA